MSLDTLRAMLRCCESWEPDVCIMGNVRSADAANALRDALAEDARICTCHPDDNPPKPCPRKFALSQCREAAEAEKAEPVAWGQLGMMNGRLYLRTAYESIPYPPPADVVRNLNLVPLYADHPAALPDDEVLFVFDAAMQGRHWWSGGTWLYPGDAVVVRRAVAKKLTPAALPESADEDAAIAKAWDRFTAELENPSPLTDEEILEIWSPSLDVSVQRPILGKNKILAFARAVLAAARGKG